MSNKFVYYFLLIKTACLTKLLPEHWLQFLANKSSNLWRWETPIGT